MQVPVSPFARLGLNESLQQRLVALAYREPTAVQRQAIPPVLAGRDVLASAQTGTGKTAAFLLPLLQRLCQQGEVVAHNQVRALVLVPTRELAQQVADSLRRYSEGLPLRSAVAYGGVSINPQMMAMRRGVDVLVATPGRLLDLIRQNAVRLRQLQILVLDEADRMLDLGFQQDLAALLPLVPARTQKLLFSATFSPAIRQLSAGLLQRPVTVDVSPQQPAAVSVKQWLVPVDKARKPALCCHLLQQNSWPQVLVFAKTRKGVEQLAGVLQRASIGCDTLHGDKPQPARLRALQRFTAGEVRVLVATDVAARGLDIAGLPAVINLDLPIVAEDYVHRIGRTGRAGSRGVAISLVCADEVQLLTAIETLLRQSLPREEEPDFEPDHRVPQTRPGNVPRKKPKKPKQKRLAPSAAAGRPPSGKSLADKPSAGQSTKRNPSSTHPLPAGKPGGQRARAKAQVDRQGNGPDGGQGWRANSNAVTKPAGKSRRRSPQR